MVKKICILRGDEGSGKTTITESLVEKGLFDEGQLVTKESAVEEVKQREPWASELTSGLDPYETGTTNGDGITFRDAYYKRFPEKVAEVLEREESVLVDCNFSKPGDVSEFVSSIAELVGEAIEVQVITITANFGERRAATADREKYEEGAKRPVTDKRSGFKGKIDTPEHEAVESFTHHKVLNGKPWWKVLGERPPIDIAIRKVEQIINPS